MNIPFIKYSKMWLFISGVAAVISVIFLIMWGLKPGIDFTGGSLMELRFAENRPVADEIKAVFVKSGLEVSTQNSGEKILIVRTSFLDENKHQEILTNLKEVTTGDITEISFETVGPTISQQLKQRAWMAIVLVSLGIIIYIAYAFRKVSRPVASWKYGLLAVIALIHDLLIVIGVFALLGHFYGIEVNTPFVVALLTVLGYSVNDTIVVYDRIRENLLRRREDDFGVLVNAGLNQTLWRSVNTSFTTLLTLFALYFFGGSTIHSFVLALLIGIASGAYSSIFIASPLLVVVEKWQRK
jgi:preprotein translocase subunit SecF